MKQPHKKTIQDVLTSIFIGACVAFLTSFMEGTLHYLNGLDNNVIAGVASALTFGLRHRV